MDKQNQIEVPWRSLSSDALDGVIEEFVTREGTDYGNAEYSLADKCQAVRRQLEIGEAKITWDESTQSCSIVATTPTLK